MSIQMLTNCLQLRKLDDQTYEGDSEKPSLPHIFGGQVLAQAKVAAANVVPKGRTLHSLHAYFLRAGDPNIPVTYHVEPLRTGNSFSTVHVSATQRSSTIYTCMCSFHRDEEGYNHQVQEPLPTVLPKTLESHEEFWRRISEERPDISFHNWEFLPGWDLRCSTWDNSLSQEAHKPNQTIWIKTKEPLPNNAELHQTLLTYISDYLLLGQSLLPHPLRLYQQDCKYASLDHAIWYHTPARIDDWLRYELSSHWAGNSRGLNSGRFYSPDGTLVASTIQEGLMRVHKG